MKALILTIAVLIFATLTASNFAQAADGDIPPPGPDAVALPAGSTPPPTTALPAKSPKPRMSAPSVAPSTSSDVPASAETGVSGSSEHNFLIKSTFGPSQCRIVDLSKEDAKALRADCDNWISERRSELGHHYVTGTCTEACEECNMNLRRCSYKGTVHYSK